MGPLIYHISLSLSLSLSHHILSPARYLIFISPLAEVIISGAALSSLTMLTTMLSSVSLLPGSAMLRAPTTQRGALVQMGGDRAAAPVLTEENLRETLKRSLEDNPKKYIALLGSTGSIGTQTLDICREYPDYFEVISLSAGANVELLAKQIAEFEPKVLG